MSQSFLSAPRVVLLVEIERYCEQPDCLRLNRIALTRAEAVSGYNGFNCERCETWNVDALKSSDVPADWRQDLQKEINGETAA